MQTQVFFNINDSSLILPGQMKVTLYSGCRPSTVIPTFYTLDDAGKRVSVLLDLPLDTSDLMFNDVGYVVVVPAAAFIKS